MKLNKITLAMLMGIVALNVATVSMSVAWYARSARVYIDAIDIVFDGDKDLKIATKVDGDYVDHLDYSDLNPVNFFAPVTSAHSNNWLSQKKDTPEFYDDSKVSLVDQDLEKVTQGFYSQRLYLMSDDDIYVTIDPSKTNILPNEAYNKANLDRYYEEIQQSENSHYKSFTKEELLERQNRLVDAMRISFLVVDEDNYGYQIIDPHKDGDTYLGGVLDNDIDEYYDYYTGLDNKHYEHVYGELIGDPNNLVYNEEEQQDSGYLIPDEPSSAFNARHKAGVKTFNEELSNANGVSIKKEESYGLEDFELGNVKYHFPVYKDTPLEIVVSIYIEGWDLESVNYTMGASFLASLGFKIEREM